MNPIPHRLRKSTYVLVLYGVVVLFGLGLSGCIVVRHVHHFVQMLARLVVRADRLRNQRRPDGGTRCSGSGGGARQQRPPQLAGAVDAQQRPIGLQQGNRCGIAGSARFDDQRGRCSRCRLGGDGRSGSRAAIGSGGSGRHLSGSFATIAHDGQQFEDESAGRMRRGHGVQAVVVVAVGLIDGFWGGARCRMGKQLKSVENHMRAAAGHAYTAIGLDT